jgi:CO/xanthine dehydrogenase FAD-binding subunit
MRGDPEQFSITTPANLTQALALLATVPGMIPFAGGTDLMVLYEAGRLVPKHLLDLHAIKELATISTRGDELVIGSMATYQQIKNHPTILSTFPNLVAAAKQTGSVAIQNRGTIGGNIANASPGADTPPALIAYEAVIEVVGKDWTRRIPYEQFHLEYKKTARKDNELIYSVRLPLKSHRTHHYYRKVGTRNAQAISKVVMAGSANVVDGVVEHLRLAIGSVGPTVIHCKFIEKLLVGEAITKKSIDFAVSHLSREINPIDDIRSTIDYRRTVAENLLTEFLSSLL